MCFLITFLLDTVNIVTNECVSLNALMKTDIIKCLWVSQIKISIVQDLKTWSILKYA